MKVIAQTNSSSAADSERFFFRIVSWSIALAFGFAFASIESLEKNAAGFAFHLSSRTLIAYAIGSAVGWIVWKVMSLDPGARAASCQRMATCLLLLGGAAGFLYPLRFLSGDHLIEVLEGLAIVTVALSLVGCMLARIRVFLNQDAARTES